MPLISSGIYSLHRFVWDEYIWNNDSSKYSQFNGKPIPSRIPLSTMIAGKCNVLKIEDSKL